MSKPETHTPTKGAAVGDGRGPTLDANSAAAIAEANAAAGFPPPPIVEAVLDGATTKATPAPQTDKPAKSGAAN